MVTTFAPTRNCTLVTVPSLSKAEAWMVTLAGAAKTVPDAGLVMVTVGGEFGAVTVIVPFMPKLTCWVQ